MYRDPLYYNPMMAQAIAEAHMPHNVLNAKMSDYAYSLNGNLRRHAGEKASTVGQRLIDIAARVFAPPMKNKWRNVPVDAAIVAVLPEGYKDSDLPNFGGYKQLNDACKEKDVALVCKLGDRKNPQPAFKPTEFFDWVVYIDTKSSYAYSTHVDLPEPATKKPTPKTPTP